MPFSSGNVRIGWVDGEVRDESNNTFHPGMLPLECSSNHWIGFGWQMDLYLRLHSSIPARACAHLVLRLDQDLV